jgi:hypothetical protein
MLCVCFFELVDVFHVIFELGDALCLLFKFCDVLFPLGGALCLAFKLNNVLRLLSVKLSGSFCVVGIALCLIFKLSDPTFLAFDSNLLFAYCVLCGLHGCLDFCLCTNKLAYVATYGQRTGLD